MCAWKGADECELTNKNVFDESMYLGKIQINLNDGKKRKFLYFQADYLVKQDEEGQLRKLSKIAGVTLIEMLIGVAVSSIMIAAMYSSYTVINNSYSKVTDVASISRSGRVIVAMLMRDIRICLLYTSPSPRDQA